MGIVAAVASSFRDKEVGADTFFIGEVGLAGEVRAVNFIEKRINEGMKMGFKTCVIPENNLKSLKGNFKIELVGVKSVNEMLDKVLGKK